MTSRSILDRGGNLAAFVLVVVVNVLSNALPINNQSMPEISAKYPSLFTPAGFTFSIWGLIYLGLLAFVVFQALPSQRTNTTLKTIDKPFVASCIANASWIIAWHYDLLVLSLLIMLVLLFALIRIYRVLRAAEPDLSTQDRLFVKLPFSLYLGWVTLATIANLSVVQTGMGWDDLGLTAVNWTLLKLAVAGAVGATIVSRLGDAVFVLVVAWAAYGIAVNQSATPAVGGAAWSLVFLALILAGFEAFRRVRAYSKPAS